MHIKTAFIVFVILAGTEAARLWNFRPEPVMEDNYIDSDAFRFKSRPILIPASLVVSGTTRDEKMGEPLNPLEFSDANVKDPNPQIVDPDAHRLDNPDYFEGDIAIDEETRLELNNNLMLDSPPPRNAIREEAKKWPNAIVPYVISAGFSEGDRRVIARAMATYHKMTCVEFRPKNLEKDYILISAKGGCSSYVGRARGEQKVELGRGCINEGTISHELMHALGFWHEQSRPDRDKYIDIIVSNIRKGMEHNFVAKTWETIRNLSVGYDEGSVMHYSATAFAKDRRKPTIVSRRNKKIGQRIGLSTMDIAKINAMYNCHGTDPSPATTTTPKPPPEGDCVDKNQNCAYWAKNGECDINKWMVTACRKSCKKCDQIGQCTDTKPECATYARQGHCKMYPSYMLPHCKKSCNVCPSTTPTGVKPTVCVDKNQHCHYWANVKNECVANPRFMHKNCAKSCNTC